MSIFRNVHANRSIKSECKLNTINHRVEILLTQNQSQQVPFQRLDFNQASNYEWIQISFGYGAIGQMFPEYRYTLRQLAPQFYDAMIRYAKRVNSNQYVMEDLPSADRYCDADII